MLVTVEGSSAEPGEDVRVRVDGASIEAGAEIRVQVAAVEEDHTSWVFSTIGHVLDASAMSAVATFSHTLPPGIYSLTQVLVGPADAPTHRLSLRAHSAAGLFEIRTAGSEPKTGIELQRTIEGILARREARFRAGFGEGTGDFLGLAFVRDCYLTTRMRIGAYEVIPFGGLGCLDELGIVQPFLRASQLPEIAPVDREIEEARRGQPVFVVHFPTVRGNSVEDAGALVEDEADRLAALLSLKRDGYGAVFATVVVDKSGGSMHYRLLHPTYHGNLLGGLVAGEHAPSLARRAGELRQDKTLRLYVDLYREALRERDPDFRYFRLWTVLEVIARSKGYVGRPLLDWSGAAVVNRRGDLRTIQDEAEDIVGELLRETLLAAQFGNESFRQGLRHGLITQMIPIWYRRRNCVAHGGDCLCRDPALPLGGKPKYAICKSARDEMSATSGGIDQYSSILRDVVKIVVEAQFS